MGIEDFKIKIELGHDKDELWIILVALKRL